MLSTNEVIEKYNISNQTIKRKIKNGELHPIKEKNKNFFDEEELDIVFKNEDKLEELKKKLKDHYGYDPYIFLEGYTDCNTNIKCICNRCKNKISIRPSNMTNNIRLNRNPPCKYCGAKASGEKQTKTMEEYLKDIKEICNDNYTVLEEYIDGDTPIKHRCNLCGHKWDVSPSNILNAYKNNKHTCPKCNNMVRDDRPYDIRLKEINPNIIPLEEYKGRKTKIEHKCLICEHKWPTTPNSMLNGSGCPKCANKITQSKAELEIIEFLKSYNLNILEKNRTILNGKEIDIYLPDYKLGIEINGNYWHSEKYKGKKYHKEKTDTAEEKNIRLIQIMDDEWNIKKDIVKSKILYILKLNKNLPKVYARNCYIKEITSKEKNEFLNNNHIQGEDKSNIKLGLFDKKSNILMSVMTFAKPRTLMGSGGKTINYDYELTRFASNKEYIVIGGFSKLFSYFKNKYEWNNIISYADRRYSFGNLYETTGWEKLHITNPNYWYVNKNTKVRYHRFSFRKSVLKNKFPKLYDENLTEFEIMDKTEYFRVWDCGNIAYKYSRN